MTNQDDATPNKTKSHVINCGEFIDITVVMEWRNKLLKILPVASDVVLEASDIERIDTTGLQVLIAFIKDANVKGISITWLVPSDVMRNAARLTGLTDALELPNAV